ncbi:adhesion G protein-coupled receptor A3-like [Octopus vulgaris]|uniref:Adhesion G protein-coupled receptor A3-like n=1 Tax=Octopus vulgaris TaxID=6645 RepID=A0AA36BL09_OCTVU|nr:adhesion G protein-coupled receptor A3-like [Octopus vulgaris]
MIKNDLPENVVQLDLSENAIKALKQGDFTNLSSLQKLDLSHNQIESIEPGTFENLTKLLRLDISHNKLKDFQSSHLRCDCHLQWIVKWSKNNSVKIQDTTVCAMPSDVKDRPIKELKRKDLHCERPLELPVFELLPSTNQIVFEGDKLPFECRAFKIDDEAEMFWVRKGKRMHTNRTAGIFLHETYIPDRQIMINRLVIEKLNKNHQGVWECQVTTPRGNVSDSVNVKSVDEKNALDQARGLRDILSGNSGKIKHSIEGGQIFNIMLDTASDILDLNDKLLVRAQQNNNSCSRIMKSLEVMTKYVLQSNSHKSGRTQNIYVEAFNETMANYKGMSCFLRGNPTLTLPYTDVRFRCRPGDGLTSYIESTRKDTISAIYMPETLFHNSDLQLSKSSTIGLQFASIMDPSGFPIIKLGDPKLEGKKWKVASKIISGSVGYSITNLSDPVILVFHTSPSVDREKLQAVYWDFYSNNGLGEWRTDGCSIVGHQRNHTIVHCYHLTNFALLQNLTPALRTGFVMMEPVIYFGSCVCVLCTMAVILTYTTCFRFIRVPKKMKHSVINISISILLLVIGFTMGINRVDNRRACQIVGICIHYCSLCCIFWVTITSNNMLKKFAKAERPPPPPPEPLIMPLPPKPMLRFYLLGWGVPLIICGITAAVNMDHYAGMDYCYLSWDPGLGAFYGPVALLVGINLVYFLRISCVIRGSSTNPSYSEETEELHVNEIELSPNQEHLHPHHHHHHHHHHNNNTNQPHQAPPSIPLHVNNHHRGGSSVSGSRNQPDNRSIHSDDSNISSISSILDEERRPITQLRALVTFLFLFIVAWVCAAFAVAQPFRAIVPKQEIIFSYLYGLSSIILGGFLVGFFCLLRDDSRDCWRRFFCCEKDEVEIARITPPNVNHMTHINGHVRSGSSVDGESLTGKMYNNERSNKVKVVDRPIKQINLVPIQPATFTDGSVSSAHEAPYPNFYNPRQNGVAKKFWEKNRHNHLKLINKEINKDISDFNSVNFDDSTKRYSHCTSSDANTHWSIEIQIQANADDVKNGGVGLQKQPVPGKIPNQLPLNIHEPLFPSLPLDRNQIPPVGGPTSPETITASPSCSFISPSGSQTLPHCHSPGASSLTSYQHSSAFTPVQPKRCNTLPKIGKAVEAADQPNEYMVRDGSVPRLRDFDGQSEVSADRSANVECPENHVLQGYLPPESVHNSAFQNSNKDPASHQKLTPHNCHRTPTPSNVPPTPPNFESNHIGCKCDSDENNCSSSNNNNNKQLNDNQFVFHESDSQIQCSKHSAKNHDSDHHSDPTHQRRHRNTHRHSRLSKQHSLGWDEQFKNRPPKVPYAYVNHSYQEKVIQKLLKKCEEEGGMQEESHDMKSNLYWFPRSFSSYEHRRTRGRRVAKLAEDDDEEEEEEEDDSGSSSDSESIGNVWLPQRQDSLTSKFKKETSV